MSGVDSMSEQNEKNPSTNKDRKPSSSDNKSVDSKKNLEEMKNWADQQKKKEDETLANKTTKKESSTKPKNSSAKAQPVKRTVANPSKAKEMPKIGSAVKHSEQKSTTKKVAKESPKATVKSPIEAKKTSPVKTGKKKHNYLLWAAGVVVLIPCLLLLYIIIGSMGSSDEPIEGNRFKGSLDPEISQEEVSSLSTSLSLENVESINVTLKSATLRVTINTNDDLSQEAINDIMIRAYEQVIEKFPVETYFKNRTSEDSIIKMYDLDIDVYNYIPTNDEEKAGQIHISRTKNSSAEDYVDDVISQAKDAATSEELLNPDTSTPPTDETNGTEEGE